ncbi:hypothetical protein BT96DRAFT_979768 [Gymnopus androsaceus JB14]|uniref:Uncharacterized protein n=1 Tax=Gymnopus androsaceus JB14 TaxID=1447944 RepID=A0A6A4H1J4_9AGAR|nr:hypothetical protein BT96DRAFT_979768 [Gymnopus androsaceus JB14]
MSVPRRIVNRVNRLNEKAMHFQGVVEGTLFTIEGETCVVPIPIIRQINMPTRSSPDYLYTEYWIFSVNDTLSTTRAMVTNRNSTALASAKDDFCFIAYYLKPSLLSTILTPTNDVLADIINSSAVPSGDVLVVKFSYDRSSVQPIDMIQDASNVKLLLERFVNSPMLFLATLDSSDSAIIGPFILSFLNISDNSHLPLLIAAPRSSLVTWLHCAVVERWTLESSITPKVFVDHVHFYLAYCTLKGRRIRLLFSKDMHTPIYLLLAFSNLASANVLTAQSMYMPYPRQVLYNNFQVINWSHDSMPAMWRTFTDSATWNLRWGSTREGLDLSSRWTITGMCEDPQCPLEGTWTMHAKLFPW